MPKTAAKTKEKFTCSYCGKSFARERTIESHSCEPRRRFRSKNDKGVQLAFEVYQRFYRVTQGHHGKQKTFEDFIRGPYYSAFVSFGEHCISSSVISVTRFADFLIKKQIPLDRWTSNNVYLYFLKYFIKIEPVADALTRTITYSMEWGADTDMNPHDLFRYGSSNTTCHKINMGVISPWVLYQSQSGNKFLLGLDDWQHEGLWDMINADDWGKIFKNNPDDVDFAKSTLKLGGW